MSEQDRLRTAFDKMRRDVGPWIERPGLDAAYRTVRRRRDRNTIVACVAVVVAFVGSLTFVNRSAHPLPTNSPSASTSWSPAPTDSPPATVAPSTEASNTAQAPPCSNGGRPDLSHRRQVFSVSLDPAPCASYRVKLIWATYTETNHGLQDATMNLYESGSAYLDSGHPAVQLLINPPANCSLLVVVYGRDTIPATFSSYQAVFGGPDTLALMSGCQIG